MTPEKARRIDWLHAFTHASLRFSLAIKVAELDDSAVSSLSRYEHKQIRSALVVDAIVSVGSAYKTGSDSEYVARNNKSLLEKIVTEAFPNPEEEILARQLLKKLQEIRDKRISHRDYTQLYFASEPADSKITLSNRDVDLDVESLKAAHSICLRISQRIADMTSFD